jgi:hypothetical protein
LPIKPLKRQGLRFYGKFLIIGSCNIISSGYIKSIGNNQPRERKEIKMDFPAGTTRRLTDDITITIGSITDITAHPSGTRFDGPAVIVAAFINSFGIPFIDVVSITDPGRRIVRRRIS